MIDWLSDLWYNSVVVFFGSIFLGIFALAYALIALQQHATFGAELAKWESLRSQVRAMRCDGYDVRQATLAVEVAKENADLSAAKYYNRQWWADLTIPDEIENVEPIVVCGGAK